MYLGVITDMSVANGTNYVASRYSVTSSLLFSCLYSPVFVFLNTLEDIILKGDGL
jgi:hypothetical protein